MAGFPAGLLADWVARPGLSMDQDTERCAVLRAGPQVTGSKGVRVGPWMSSSGPGGESEAEADLPVFDSRCHPVLREESVWALPFLSTAFWELL